MNTKKIQTNIINEYYKTHNIKYWHYYLADTNTHLLSEGHAVWLIKDYDFVLSTNILKPMPTLEKIIKTNINNELMGICRSVKNPNLLLIDEHQAIDETLLYLDKYDKNLSFYQNKRFDLIKVCNDDELMCVILPMKYK